jgi:hypothetical protein
LVFAGFLERGLVVGLFFGKIIAALFMISQDNIYGFSD